MVARLSTNQAAAVICVLQRMPANTNTQKLIDKLIDYLRQDQGRIDSTACKEAGIPTGSGDTEPANKFICHASLEHSGGLLCFRECHRHSTSAVLRPL